MLNPTIDKLQTMRLYGMSSAFAEQLKQPDIEALSFNERFALLVDSEMIDKENRRLKSRLRKAKLKQSAAIVKARINSIVVAKENSIAQQSKQK